MSSVPKVKWPNHSFRKGWARGSNNLKGHAIFCITIGISVSSVQTWFPQDVARKGGLHQEWGKARDNLYNGIINFN